MEVTGSRAADSPALAASDAAVKAMERGEITPLDGWKQLKGSYATMSESERTTDYCRVVAELEPLAEGPDFGARLAGGIDRGY